jgi:aryl-alcohol dehydrogenase-like predicted oxidoreductase
VPALGVGTNRWGGGSTTDEDGLQAVYAAALDAGTGFFDTAEVYTGGRSERAIGHVAAADSRPVVVATKFAPYPHRLTAARLSRALDRSLGRLGLESIDLYYLHFPFSPVSVGTWMNAMALAVKSGKIRAVGVSNCSPSQMQKAATALARHDVPLAANQVHYSLAHRKPEFDGVLDSCRELDVALVAYRPLSSGSLSSGTGVGSNSSGLLGLLEELAVGRGATVAQVALAWLLQRDEHVVAIPGATKPAHVLENAGALALELSAEEFVAIDNASASGSRR